METLSGVNYFLSKANLVHGNIYDYSSVNYVSSILKIEIICSIHGNFWQVPSSHLSGHGCAKCAGVGKYTAAEFIVTANNKHGGKYDYSKTIYMNTRDKVIITCPIHGDFLQSPKDHLNGSDCQECAKITASSAKINDLSDQVFGRLKVIEMAGIHITSGGSHKAKWLCQCDCGNEIIVKSCNLISGNTKSCGCLHLEQSSKNVVVAQRSNIKYPPRIFTARQVWHGEYSDGLSFDDFYRLSQLNCFYCGSQPKRSANVFNTKKFANSYANKEDGVFIYNGLDRVDSSRAHILDNVVTCCSICNRAKTDKNICDFMVYISRLINNVLNSVYEYRSLADHVPMCDLSRKYFGSSVKCTYRGKYNDGDLTIEQFYKLSQLNCYYCGSKPSNKANKYKAGGIVSQFVYSGLDRLDCSVTHNYENVVPCCHGCNFAKSNVSVEEFLGWIELLKNNHSELLDNYERMVA